MPFESESRVKYYVKSIEWEKRLKKEIPFISRLFKKENYINIADLGSGPGFHAIAMAEHGFNVTGIDVSKSMIFHSNNLMANTNLPVNFILGNIFDDMSIFPSNLDAIYSLGNAIMIIWSEENVEITRMFSLFSKVIKSGGGLFFQILNSDNPRNGYVTSKISHDEKDKKNQMLIKHFLPIEDRLYTHFMTIKWREGENEVIKEENDPSYLKLVTHDQLKNILLSTGFSNVKFFANYQGDPLIPESSDSLLCFAKKA